MKEYAPTVAVLLDIDGTLLDSNDAHAFAWVEALAAAGRPLPYERIRPLIGKGTDKVLAELLGLAEDDPLARQLADERKRRFLTQHLPSLSPTPGTRPLLEHMKAEGLVLAVVTSASSEELQALLRQAGVDDLIEQSTTSSDAAHSKPDPDLVAAAVQRCGIQPIEAIMIGDTPYDVEAASAAGVDCIAFRCGGAWDDAALSGAVAIFDSPADLLARWEDSPIFKRRIPAG